MRVALEGIDGSGKATVAALLRDKLAGQGRSTELISFPRYEETRTSALIADLLNGRFKPPSPAAAATVFALDRAEFFARETLRADVTIFDRFVMSNVAFQTARLEEAEADALGAWIVDLEYARLKTPAPTLNVLLDVSEQVAAGFLMQKGTRSYTAEKMDAYEADRAFQNAVRRRYLSFARASLGGPWLVVPVAPGSAVEMSPEAAAAMILAAL